MESEFTSEIVKLAEKHMPATLVGVFAERLEELEATAAEAVELRETVRKLRQYESWAGQEEELDRREDNLMANRNDLNLAKAEFEMSKELFEAQTELKYMRQSLDHVKEINSNLVRNTLYRNMVFGSTPVKDNGYISQQPFNQTTEESAE